MINKIEALYYKGFKYINVDLKPFNVLVGPNASGKSSLLDILIFLKDILNSGPAAAVQKRSSNFMELIWNQEKDYFEFAIEFIIPPKKNDQYRYARYEISLAQDPTEGIIIRNENLWLLKSRNGSVYKSPRPRQLKMFPQDPDAPDHIVMQRKKTPSGWRKVISKSSKGNDYFKSENTDWNILYRFGPKKASLARVPDDETRFPIAIWVKNILAEGIQLLQLNSVNMLWPCRPDAPVLFEPDGSNLPKVIKYLQENHCEAFSRWVEHVSTALNDVSQIDIVERPEDRHLYIQIRYLNNTIPSWLLSDGTLRLLAQTVIAYLPESDKVYIIEEPENGLHPLALETAIQSLSSIYDNQIILATHSPVVLRLSEPKDILCFSKTPSGTIDVVGGEKHPKLKDWKRDVDLATLHAAGVLQ